MSWNFEVAAKDIEEGKALVQADEHMPDKVKSFLIDTISAFRPAYVPAGVEAMIYVKSSGHVGPDYSNVECFVRPLWKKKAAPSNSPT